VEKREREIKEEILYIYLYYNSAIY